MTDHRCKISNSRDLVLEFAVMEAPLVCPHCKSAWPGWRGDSNFCSCLYCGEDWERPIGVTGNRAA